MKVSKEKKLLLEETMQACINAYRGSHGIVDATLFDSVQWFNYDSKEYPRFFIGWRSVINTLYVVFKGTTGAKGWETNFNYKQIRHPHFDVKGRWHKGFVKQDLNSPEVFHKIVRHITDFEKDAVIPYDIIVTGHSKGGSLAPLCAYQLSESSLKKVGTISCVSFGSARTTSVLAAREYRKAKIPTIVVKNGNDMVCRVPFRITFGLIQRKFSLFGNNMYPGVQLWSHVSKITYVGRPWYIYLMHRLPFVRFIGNPLDHRPVEYMKAIQELKTK